MPTIFEIVVVGVAPSRRQTTPAATFHAGRRPGKQHILFKHWKRLPGKGRSIGGLSQPSLSQPVVARLLALVAENCELHSDHARSCR